MKRGFDQAALEKQQDREAEKGEQKRDQEIDFMKEPTDQQLKQALANLLPEKLIWYCNDLTYRPADFGKNNELPTSWPLDTELLHICHLIEQELSEEQWLDYIRTLDEDVIRGFGGKYRSMQDVCHASWQQRTLALSRVKGVEI